MPLQHIEKLCLKDKRSFLQGEYEGETGAIGGPEGAGNRKAATVPGSPFVLNRMPAKSLCQQVFAPRSGSFSARCAGRKAAYS